MENINCKNKMTKLFAIMMLYVLVVAIGNRIGIKDLLSQTVYAASNTVISDVIATASSYAQPFTPDRAVNLTQDSSQAIASSRWYCSGTNDTKWLQLDLKKEYYMDRWRVENLGALGWDESCNTKNYALQGSLNGTNWTTIQQINKNTNNITDNIVTPFIARYVRLYITQGNQNNNLWASIADFKVYEAPAAGKQLKAGSLKYNNGTVDTLITGNDFIMPATNVTITAEFEAIPIVKQRASRY